MNRPKKIHYCWFGNKAIPEKEKGCIESWNSVLPDWKIVLWNESSYDLNRFKFARQAYDKGMFAFVSDCVRADVLFRFGGLYLDTDVKLFSGFSELLAGHRNFVGFETKRQVGTAVMAFEPHHSAMKELVEYYSGDFAINGQMVIEANVAYLTQILQNRGLLLNRQTQEVEGITVFNREYFFPKRLADDSFQITPNTVAVHCCSGSWMSLRQKKRGKSFFWVKIMRPVLLLSKRVLLFIVGKRATKKIEMSIRNVLR